MTTRMLAGVGLSLVLAFCTQPVHAQRGGGPGGGSPVGGGGGGARGGGCSGQPSSSQSATLSASPYTQNALSPYTQNSLAQGYALQQMQQQYVQQAMGARQMMAQMQMENQRLQAQLLQMQNQERLAASNANGDSNQLLTPPKSTKALNAKTVATKKKASSRSRTAAQLATDKTDEKQLALK